MKVDCWRVLRNPNRSPCAFNDTKHTQRGGTRFFVHNFQPVSVLTASHERKERNTGPFFFKITQPEGIVLFSIMSADLIFLRVNLSFYLIQLYVLNKFIKTVELSTIRRTSCCF